MGAVVANSATKFGILQVLCYFHLSHRDMRFSMFYIRKTENVIISAGKMNRSVLLVLCLVTLSIAQLGQSQCGGEV